ncbi:MAG TPA: RNA 2',3'-cyclic phosphodiesterase [Anaerolineales bacterium]|nr:RNA 2',3'-cyclic phosphodiesterase [Anaerolineales bacterium]
MRTFLALTLPETCKESLAQVQKTLQLGEASGVVRWVAPSQFHLTLYFLGDSSEKQVSQWQKDFAEWQATGKLQDCLQWGFQFEQIGVFPNWRKPSVLWVGLQSVVQAEMHTLYDFQRELAHLAQQYGYASTPAFSPHITIGRVSRFASPAQQASLAQQIPKPHLPSTPTFQFSSLTLFASELRPSGAVYRKLASVVLNSA